MTTGAAASPPPWAPAGPAAWAVSAAIGRSVAAPLPRRNKPHFAPAKPARSAPFASEAGIARSLQKGLVAPRDFGGNGSVDADHVAALAIGIDQPQRMQEPTAPFSRGPDHVETIELGAAVANDLQRRGARQIIRKNCPHFAHRPPLWAKAHTLAFIIRRSRAKGKPPRVRVRRAPSGSVSSMTGRRPSCARSRGPATGGRGAGPGPSLHASGAPPYNPSPWGNRPISPRSLAAMSSCGRIS